MADDKEPPKIGAGHAAAMMRLGLKELRAAVYPESNVGQPGELGLYGSLTPGEVRDGKKPEEGRDPEEEKGSVLADRMRQAADRDDRGRDDRDKER